MQKFISLIIISLILKADIISNFKAKKYDLICNYTNIKKYENNPNIESIVGLSCVKSDKLMLLPYIIKRLRINKKARINSIYFLTIYMQKRLLYSYLFDGLDILDFSFPKTDYILSYIFEAIKNKKFIKKDDRIIIKNDNITYVIYKENTKMIVETFKNDILIKRRWYR